MEPGCSHCARGAPVRTAGGHVSRPRPAGTVDLILRGRRKGPLISPKAQLRPGPTTRRALGEARRQAQSKGSGRVGSGQAVGGARGKWMSYGTTRTERELTQTPSHPQAGALGPRKRRGLAQSPTAREAAACPTLRPNLAPPGGRGWGGELALTRGAQAEGDPAARAAVLDA